MDPREPEQDLQRFTVLRFIEATPCDSGDSSSLSIGVSLQTPFRTSLLTEVALVAYTPRQLTSSDHKPGQTLLFRVRYRKWFQFEAIVMVSEITTAKSRCDSSYDDEKVGMFREPVQPSVIYLTVPQARGDTAPGDPSILG